jgi:Family of unknown function (DUF695)
MALFGKRSTRSGSPITEFWAWWAREGEAAFTAAIEKGSFGAVTKPMSKYVAAIHPDLGWDTSKGETSQHELCVSASGIAELRSVAERWLRAGPAANGAWQYSASKRRSPETMAASMEIDGAKLDLANTVFAVSVDRSSYRVAVTVYNPEFARMTEQSALQVAYLTLDWSLGEDHVERWVGEVAVTDAEPEISISTQELARIADEFATARDAGKWSLLRMQTQSGSDAMATVRTAVRWIDYPTFDLFSAISVGYADVLPNGWPGPHALDELREFEDQLVEVLGVRGVLVGHTTSDAQRAFLVYSDAQDQNATASIRHFMSAHGDAEPFEKLDPAWREVRFITG